MQDSSVAVTPTVTLTQGTVDGTGTINTVNAAAGTITQNIDNALSGTAALVLTAVQPLAMRTPTAAAPRSMPAR